MLKFQAWQEPTKKLTVSYLIFHKCAFFFQTGIYQWQIQERWAQSSHKQWERTPLCSYIPFHRRQCHDRSSSRAFGRRGEQVQDNKPRWLFEGLLRRKTWWKELFGANEDREMKNVSIYVRMYVCWWTSLKKGLISRVLYKWYVENTPDKFKHSIAPKILRTSDCWNHQQLTRNFSSSTSSFGSLSFSWFHVTSIPL